MSLLYDLFIPHRENSYRAGILKPPAFSFLTLVFILYQIFFNFVAFVNPQVLGYSSNITPERIIELTNQKRLALGLAPVKENPLLSEAARRKAADMFVFNYWSHNSPSGRDPWSFLKEVGYKYQYAGENLARDFRDPESVVEAWMNSPSHRENIVNSKYQEIGIAVVDGTLQGIETTLVVQFFGTQLPQVAKKPAVEKPVAEQPAIAEKPVQVQAGAEQPEVLPQIPSLETISKEAKGEFAPMINPFSATKVIGIFLTGVIFGAFLVDMFLVSERKTPRLSGRSFAQLLFLGFIILLALVSQQGAVL